MKGLGKWERKRKADERGREKKREMLEGKGGW